MTTKKNHALWNAVEGALKSAMQDHPEITIPNLDSVTKRIVGQVAQQWQPIETAPRNTRLLLRVPLGVVIGGYNDPHAKRAWDWSSEGWIFEKINLSLDTPVIGWMPLPE